ncbi:hypothetical protein ACUN9Y_09775 [Halomonas sp. V046]|uniref:hypothetical protein n=1 Tax=Halomonas sp. V046 TaxID=3459611 RepID=UPI004043D188
MSEYEITQWRKRLERKGWLGLSWSSPPIDRLVEYHVVWQGWLISGRCRLDDENRVDWWEPETPQYLRARKHGVSDGVWRQAKGQGEEVGQARRKFT